MVNLYLQVLKNSSINEWKNQRIVFISVLPIASSTTYAVKDPGVVEFNQLVQEELVGTNILYCDVYNGIGPSNFGYSSDGLHYNNATSKKNI
ncbi:MAG: hypothetical protein IJO32_05980 [Bacilli bacterium]|nr:hypothetical protein [Bacilli bacterium]